MIARLTQTLFGVALFAACAGGRAGAQSPLARPSALGGPCHVAGECRSGLFCDKADPEGQCSRICAASADCGAGAVCSREKKCYLACKRDADCGRTGYACEGASPNKFCEASREDELEKALEGARRYGR